MRKAILLLICLPLVLISCEENLFNVAFDYDFEGSFVLKEAIASGDVREITSEEIDLTVLEEMDERNLASMVLVNLKEVNLNLPESANIDWSYLKRIDLKIIVDGEEIDVASMVDIPETSGKSLQLSLNTEELDLKEYLNNETAFAKLSLTTRGEIPAGLEVAADVATRIVAAPIE